MSRLHMRGGPVARFSLPALVAILVTAWAERTVAAESSPPLAALEERGEPNWRAMAARVDERIAAPWKVNGVSPAQPASDSEFIRRVYLDLTGVIPPVADVRRFLNDESPHKREELIERLLTSPAHATHLANTWRNVMLPAGFETGDLNSVLGVQTWLRDRFAENMRYDRIVSELLVATGGRETGPALFYTALELKPEELAANTARIFLGVQIQCAQCHDHPFDHWTQHDFWGYAAFFAQLRRSNSQMAGNAMNVALYDNDEGEVKLPDTEEVVSPKYPEGGLARGDEGGYRRQQLSIWMASRDNPYLARALANRVWSQLFGRGIVEPVDDFGPRNPPSHPELLAELTEFFIATGFDVRMLYRTLANTRAYQLSSEWPSGEAPRADLFARMMVKSLTPEQLYDSLSQAALRGAASAGSAAANRILDPQRREFLARMQTSNRSAAEFDAGLPQALMLMNGEVMVEATDKDRSRLIAALDAPWFDDAERLEIAFLAAYSRSPTEEEGRRFLEHLRAGDRRQALGDVFWALLNSAEFALNH